MKKDKTKVIPTAAVVIALFFSLLGILLRSLSLFGAYHADTGYYDPTSILPSAFAILTAAFIPIIILLAIVFRKSLLEPMWTNGISLLFSSALLALTLLVYAISVCISLPAQTDAYVATLSALAAIFAMMFLVYLSYTLFGRELKHEGLRPYLPFALALYALLVAVALYFDKATQMNHPPKNLHMVAFIALSCYAMCEARHLLRRLKRSVAYVVTSLALFFTGAASLPNIIYSIATNRILVMSPVHDFALLAAFLYLLTRLLQMLPYKIPSLHPMATILSAREQQAAEETVTEVEEPAKSEGLAEDAENPAEVPKRTRKKSDDTPVAEPEAPESAQSEEKRGRLKKDPPDEERLDGQSSPQEE